ncbi:MAG: hypothetical protein ACRD3T_22040 [Terriglobia bacterium]
MVTHDYTIRYQGRVDQLARRDIRPGLRGGRVRVEQRLDGSLAVKFRQHYLSVAECQPRPPVTTSPSPVQARKLRPKASRNWMKDFNLHQSPPLWAIVRGESTTPARG